MSFMSLFPQWIFEQGPAFLIVLPLLMGAIIAILPNRSMAWWFTFFVTLICTYTAFGLFQHIYFDSFLLYTMGGWAPPHGISLIVDGLSAPILLLISVMAMLTVIYALPASISEIEPKKRGPFYAAFLICFAGLMGMVITGDAFNVFVFLEVSSISTYALVAMGAARDRRSLAAAYNYLIMGSIGATFFVIGLGFLFMETGTLNMAEMSAILSDLDGGTRVSKVGYGFIVVGLGLKIAMFPLHTWLPRAYAYAPTKITIFLASTATKAAIYLLLRFTFTVFDPSFDYISIMLKYLIVGAAVVGMVFASFQAIFQSDVRRVLAYSSVAQVGYILLGIGIATSSGLAAGYLHLLNHAIIKGCLFISVGAFWYRFGITRVDDFSGLFKTMPLTMGAFTLGGLSLIGVPFTAGFVSKVKLILAAAEQEMWWAVLVIVFSSVLAIVYIGRIIMAAYFGSPPKINGSTFTKNKAPFMMLFPMWVLGLMSIAIGLNAFGIGDTFVSASEIAASVLLGGRG